MNRLNNGIEDGDYLHVLLVTCMTGLRESRKEVIGGKKHDYGKIKNNKVHAHVKIYNFSGKVDNYI